MMLMQARMQMLQQQNQLLQTKIQKDDLINSARTIPSNNQKAMTLLRKGVDLLNMVKVVQRKKVELFFHKVWVV